jgi:hypothetical protein
MLSTDIEKVRKRAIKIVQKDNSVLLDLSKIKDYFQGENIYELLAHVISNEEFHHVKTLSLSSIQK